MLTGEGGGVVRVHDWKAHKVGKGYGCMKIATYPCCFIKNV